MQFAEKLRAKRKLLHLTQAELANMLEISPRAVWQWEQGRVPHILTQEGADARMAKARPKK